jgi:hypothetical protein
VGLATVVWGTAALVGAWPSLARCYRAIGVRRRGRHGRICSSACPGYVRHLLLSLLCLFYFFPSSSPSSLVTGLPCLVEVRPCRDAAAVLLVLLCCCYAAWVAVLAVVLALLLCCCCCCAAHAVHATASTGLGYCCPGHASACHSC